MKWVTLNPYVFGVVRVVPEADSCRVLGEPDEAGTDTLLESFAFPRDEDCSLAVCESVIFALVVFSADKAVLLATEVVSTLGLPDWLGVLVLWEGRASRKRRENTEAIARGAKLLVVPLF